MAELKTKATNRDPKDFLNEIEPEHKKADGFTLLEMFEKVTGHKAVMWGTSIVGFGQFHYKSERSSQQGDWPLVGFSPRKQNLTLYVLNMGMKDHPLFKKLGKHKTSDSSFGGCLYINKLADVDTEVLAELIKVSYEYMKENNPAAND